MHDSSFLPEDYLTQKAERRTNVISLTLFGIVMVAVIGAFFVTNRQATLVKQHQEFINSQYQAAGMQIQELSQLEKQREEMLNKAELAAALVERVPRSILMAELINRMPERLALLDFDMKSERARVSSTQTPPTTAQRDASGRLVASARQGRGKTVQESGGAVQKIDPPRYDVTITMVGVAPTDLELSRYMSELNTYPLLRGVTLEYSEQKEVQGRAMRQFKINMSLDPSADVRRVEPLVAQRLKNPMTDEIQFQTPTLIRSTAAPVRGGQGD